MILRNVTVVGSGASGVLEADDVGKTVYCTGVASFTVIQPIAGTGVPVGPLVRIESAGTSSDGTGDVAFAGAFAHGLAQEPDSLIFPQTLALIANGDSPGLVVARRGGIITATRAIVQNPATTAAKAATVTPEIAGVAVTGGVLTLTSANMTPASNVVAGSAVTAANRFEAGDTLGWIASAVTAFVEGTALFQMDVLYDPL
jgi:hypothetical protein